jgi:hypothetical protein
MFKQFNASETTTVSKNKRCRMFNRSNPAGCEKLDDDPGQLRKCIREIFTRSDDLNDLNVLIGLNRQLR